MLGKPIALDAGELLLNRVRTQLVQEIVLVLVKQKKIVHLLRSELDRDP